MRASLSAAAAWRHVARYSYLRGRASPAAVAFSSRAVGASIGARQQENERFKGLMAVAAAFAATAAGVACLCAEQEERMFTMEEIQKTDKEGGRIYVTYGTNTT